MTGVARDADGRGARHTLEAALPHAGRLVGLRLDHLAWLAPALPVPAVATSTDGRRWDPVAEVRRLPAWQWAGRALFKLSGGSDEWLLPPTPAAQARLELWLPTAGPAAITGVCARILPGS